jgi:glycosyltransferase involved in cell wall biosynthesis
MRIAFVAPFGLRAKGTARARALPLARALAERGNTVALFIPPYDSPEDSGKAWEQDGVRLINVRLPRGWSHAAALRHLQVSWRLLRAVRRWKPDLVHVFKPKGPSGLVGTALWLARPMAEPGKGPAPLHRQRCGLLVDSDDWEGRGGWNDDPRAGYTLLERQFFAWQERCGLSHADAWTVASDCLRDRAVSFGASPSRVFVLPNGISTVNDVPSSVADGDRHDGSRRPMAASHPPTAILYTRFAGVKTGEVIGIWGRVRAAMPEARLLVLGRGLAGEEKTLSDVPGIDVQGWLEPPELAAHFAASRLAVVPWADTPSNRARHSAKILELMAAGLPIVAYAVGELPTTLGDAAMLVTPGDQVAFAKAVVRLFSDRELAERLGMTSKQRAVTLYSWRRLVEVALEAYRVAGTSQPV